MTTLSQSIKPVSGRSVRKLRPWLLGAAVMLQCGCDGIFGPTQVEGCTPESRLVTQTLTQFSEACDDAIGIPVLGFNCDDLALIPQNNQSIGVDGTLFCDQPNILNSQCDPESRFGVLQRDDHAIVVALCRKKGRTAGYGDIAVIQYNRDNGATCFYQMYPGYDNNLPDTVDFALPPNVTAPILGATTQSPWASPRTVATQPILQCVRCHDNGPFIRSPYLAQLRTESINRLPGTKRDTLGNYDPNWDDPDTWNKTQAYTFVGNDFQNWKVFKLTVGGDAKECMNCHRQGLSSINHSFPELAQGTARNLAVRATWNNANPAISGLTHKNPDSSASPIWMEPGQISYDSIIEGYAFEVQTCAEAVATNAVRPAGCQVEQFGQGNTCAAASGPSAIPGVLTLTNQPASVLAHASTAIDLDR